MAMKRHERTTARRVALQVLYTAEIKGITAAEVVAEGTFPSEEGTLTDYALDLVRGVESTRIAIDGNLKAAAENWSLGKTFPPASPSTRPLSWRRTSAAKTSPRVS